MRVGVVLLPEHAWDIDRARWQRAEELGFHTAWTYDHLAWRTLADGPWFGTVPTLVAAALSTTHIRLGTLVASPNLRHPVTFAKDLMTLDVMSGGRLTVGVGSGTAAHDAAVMGLPELDAPRRADRFAEFVELLGVLLAQPVTDWSGEHYTAVDARMIPGSIQRPRPPLVVAANGPRGMRLAQAHGDGWVTNGRTGQGLTVEQWWGSVADAVESFDRITAEDSRTLPAGYTRLLNIETVAAGAGAAEIVELVLRAAGLGFTDVVLAWPRASDPYRGDEQVIYDLAGELDGLADAGR